MYNMVGRTPYPLWVSVQSLALATSLIMLLKYGLVSGVVLSLGSLIYSIVVWSNAVVMEGLSGQH